MPRNSTAYKLGGTKSFRRASTKILKYWGGNLQNVKKELRTIYEPDGFTPALEEKCKYWLKTGDTSVFTEEELVTLRVFIQSDQSGADALIVAYECEPKDYRQLFIHGVKPHVFVALHLFKDIWTKKLKESGGLIEDFNIDEICNTKIPDLKKNPFWHDLDLLIKFSDNWSLTERYYYLAKQTVHSANYDIQGPNFRMNVLEKSGGKIYISKEDSVNFLLVYRGLFPEIPERNRRVAEQVNKTRLLFNIFGHPYQITDYNLSDSKMKEYYAWSPQSSVAEITRIAYTNLQHYIEETKLPFDILADTHDSYLCQCPLPCVSTLHSAMKKFMCQDLISPFDGVSFRMKAECNVGFNWSPKKNENPLGLQEINWL